MAAALSFLYFRDLFAYDDRVVLAYLVLGVFLVVELAVVHVGVAVRAAEETAAPTAEPSKPHFLVAKKAAVLPRLPRTGFWFGKGRRLARIRIWAVDVHIACGRRQRFL